MPTTVSVQPIPLLQQCEIQVGEAETRVIIELQPNSGECIRLHVTVSGGDTGIPVCLKISGSTVELPYVDWTAVGRATSASDESHGAAQEESETESHMTEAARLGFHSSPPRIRDEHDPFSTPQHNRFERAHRPSTVQRNPRWGDDGLPPDREESPSVRRQMLYEQKRVLGYKPEDE